MQEEESAFSESHFSLASRVCQEGVCRARHRAQMGQATKARRRDDRNFTQVFSADPLEKPNISVTWRSG